MNGIRLRSWDLVRGFCIILMIMAHIGFGDQFDHFVHAFHMPVFFFISGYFFRNKPLKQFFWSKTKSLILPYIFYSAFIFVTWRIVYGAPDETYIHVLLYMNSTRFVSAALWFISALYLANIIYYLIINCFKSQIVNTIIVIALCLIGNQIHNYYPSPCIFAFDAAFVGVGLMHIGNFCHAINNRSFNHFMNLSLPKTVLLFFVISVLIFVNGKVNMREGIYGRVIPFWINAVGITIVLWNISNIIINSNIAKKGGALHYIIDYIIKIGERSMIYLCLNQVAIFYYFRLFPLDRPGWYAILIHNTLALIFVVMVLYPIAYIREKWTPFKSR